jgi:hypothetical protein
MKICQLILGRDNLILKFGWCQYFCVIEVTVKFHGLFKLNP